MTEPQSPYYPFIPRVLVTIALVGLTWLAWNYRSLLLLVFGAVLVAVVFGMIAGPLHRRLRLPSGLALAVAVLLVLGVLTLAIWTFGAEVVRQSRQLSELVPEAWEALQGRLEQWGLADSVQQVMGGSEARSGIVSRLSGMAMTIGGGIADLVLVIVAGVFLAAQPTLYRTGLMKLVPASRRPLLADALKDSGTALTLWLKGRLLAMAAVALMTGIGLWLIGVPAALTLGLVAGILDFVPFIGPIIAAVPAVLVALTIGPEAALWTVALYLAVQQVEGNILDPIVQQRMVTLPPAYLLFALVAGGLLFGLPGIILGAPLSVVIYVLVKRLYVQEALDTPTEMPGDKKD